MRMQILQTYEDYTVTLTVTDRVMLISETKLTLTVTLTLTDSKNWVRIRIIRIPLVLT